MDIRDRIVRLDRVVGSDLIPNPRNWRTHPAGQRQALRGVLDEIGIANAVVARETDAGLELIDGHLRIDELQDQLVPVLVLDVTEEEADKILLTLDPLSAMATRDNEALYQLLDETRFEDERVNNMLEALANDEVKVMPSSLMEAWGEDPDNPFGEWGGMPEYESAGLLSWKRFIVHFECQEDFDAFCKTIGQEINDTAKFTWFPAKAKTPMDGVKQFINVDES